jgi:drug/metabolite transporter (DMT)-like permease
VNHDPARERRIGYLCAFSVLGVWASFLLSSRLAGTQPFTPWDVGVLRYVSSALAALPLIWWLGFPRLPPLQTVAIVATAGFGFPLFAFAGFGLAPVAHGGIMMPGMLPFLSAALAAVFLDEAWSARRGAALAVVACGMGLLALDTFGAHPGAWRGDVLFLCGSCCWAIYTVLVRRWRVPAVTATLAIAFWPVFLFVPLWWLALPSNLAAVPMGAILYQFLFQGLIAVLVAGFLFTRAVNALGAARTTAITSLVPALAALAAWPLLGERLGAAGLAGVAFATLGMILAVTSPVARRHTKAA